MRRMILDVGTVICLVVTGIVLYRLSPPTVPLNFLARFENIIWVIALTTVAICRAYVERTANLPAGVCLKITGWGVIVIVAHMILFWLDTVVTPQDNFPTVFAFGFATFLLPGLVVSTIVYLAVSASMRNRT
jgi:hypothetical protein